MTKVSLAKVEQKAPELVSLVKKSKVSLSKKGLNDHTARVALMLDISGSMMPLFQSGQVNELVKRALPLALQFDDDGQIDVFCFDELAYVVGEYGIEDYKQCVPDITNSYNIEGGTEYAPALRLLEQHYAGTELPVYVIFVTDGDTAHKERATRAIQEMSKLPLFIQFVGLGKDIFPNLKDEEVAPRKGFLSKLFGGASTTRLRNTGFDYLEKIDNIDGRVVDNANFFALKHPTSVDDDRLYALLMNEYPEWLKAARHKKILK